MDEKTRLPEVNWGNYRKNQFIGDYMSILPNGKCIEDVINWMSRTVEWLKKSENYGKPVDDDLGDWALPPEQYPRW